MPKPTKLDKASNELEIVTVGMMSVRLCYSEDFTLIQLNFGRVPIRLNVLQATHVIKALSVAIDAAKVNNRKVLALQQKTLTQHRLADTKGSK